VGLRTRFVNQMVTPVNDVVSMRPGEWVTYTVSMVPHHRQRNWLARRKGTVYFTGIAQRSPTPPKSARTLQSPHQPTVQLFCDALTITYLWPAIAIARGITPETIAVSGYPRTS